MLFSTRGLSRGPKYGAGIVTAFARIDGRPVVVANQPARRAGAVLPDAARKAAESVRKCDAFGVPPLYLRDIPGFMTGAAVEREGILGAGKRMIHATSMATVPKLCGRTEGLRGGRLRDERARLRPEATLAFPSGEIAIVGPEAAVDAVYRNRLEGIDDPEERARREAEFREEYRQGIDVHRAANEVIIDGIVPPGRLRKGLVARYEFHGSVGKGPSGERIRHCPVIRDLVGPATGRRAAADSGAAVAAPVRRPVGRGGGSRAGSVAGVCAQCGTDRGPTSGRG